MLLVVSIALAAGFVPARAALRYAVPSLHHPVVIAGGGLPELLGAPIARIALYAQRHGTLTLIAYQIDRRAADGDFLLEDATQAELDTNDECVFMAAEAGDRASGVSEALGAASVSEIEIVDAVRGVSRWVYAVALSAPPPARAAASYVAYDAADDQVSSELYRATFSKQQPFLISTLSLKDPQGDQWSPNLVDTMKVRHLGKLFGRFDFVRTQADYRSKLVAVKAGPVRVIRRTANRVRVLGFLRTPTIYIDYLCYRQGVIMDLLIDVPFRIGWFFSEMVTRMTMDWNGAEGFPETKVHTRSSADGLKMDGIMSQAETRLEDSADTEFLLANRYAKMLVRLDYGSDLPIEHRVFLRDDREILDPPEAVPGQFGNVGFVTTGWERMDTKLHHMLFSVYMLTGITTGEGIKIVAQRSTWVPFHRGTMP